MYIVGYSVATCKAIDPQKKRYPCHARGLLNVGAEVKWVTPVHDGQTDGMGQVQCYGKAGEKLEHPLSALSRSAQHRR